MNCCRVFAAEQSVHTPCSYASTRVLEAVSGSNFSDKDFELGGKQFVVHVCRSRWPSKKRHKSWENDSRTVLMETYAVTKLFLTAASKVGVTSTHSMTFCRTQCPRSQLSGSRSRSGKRGRSHSCDCLYFKKRQKAFGSWYKKRSYL